MTESEKLEREMFDAVLRNKIANGEITAMDAEVEWDTHYNGYDSRESICGL